MYHLRGCGSLSLKKRMWSLEYFKIWQGDLRKSIYMSQICVWFIWRHCSGNWVSWEVLGCGSHADAVSSHFCHIVVTFCHICHRLESQSKHGRVPSAQANVTLHGLSSAHIVSTPAMAWKFDIGGVFYVVIISYFLRLNWVFEGLHCKTRVLGIYGHLAALSMLLS